MSIESTFKGITPGKRHVYYTLELMLVARIPGADPDKLWEPTPVTQREWQTIDWDRFRCFAEPMTRNTARPEPVCKEASDELHRVWELTGRHGYWTPVYAQIAADRMRKASNAKLLICTDGRGYISEYSKYLVRVVKVTVAKVVEVVLDTAAELYTTPTVNISDFCVSGMVGMEVNTPIGELLPGAQGP